MEKLFAKFINNMSNIGKKPINITEGVSVEISDKLVKVNGPKGSLEIKIPKGIKVVVQDGKIKVEKKYDSKELEKYLGLTRSLISNMVEGITKGYEKKLELVGVGFRGRIEGRDLILNVGFANSVKVTPPEGISISVIEGIIAVSGIDKQLVGDVASKIREIKIPDPYKGKGIRYLGERIRRKVGKAAKAVGGK